MDQKNAFVNFESTLCDKLVDRGHTEACSNGAFVDTQTCWIFHSNFVYHYDDDYGNNNVVIKTISLCKDMTCLCTFKNYFVSVLINVYTWNSTHNTKTWCIYQLIYVRLLHYSSTKCLNLSQDTKIVMNWNYLSSPINILLQLQKN